MSTRYIDRVPTKNYLVVDAIYASDPGLTQFLGKMQKFSQSSKDIKFDLNTSVTQNRFLIDFSSTILLAILSVLMIIFRTMDHLMMPLHNYHSQPKRSRKVTMMLWLMMISKTEICAN